MASTRQGRELSRAHQQAQLELAARAVTEQRRLLGGLLDPYRLDATRMDWLGAAVAVAEQYHGASVLLAEAYLTQYRRVEYGSAPLPVQPAVFDAARVAVALDGIVPRAKLLTGQHGHVGAVSRAFDGRLGALQRHTLAGGRGTIDLSTLANRESVGWRRYTDGQACAWCALLVARGPVYRSVETAGAGRHWHDFCGCGVEEVFGDWIPTRSEQVLVDLYARVYRPGMTDRRIAGAMRRADGPVSDSRVRLGAGPFRPMGDPPDPANKDAWRAYWKARQDAIGLDFKGDYLEAHEVLSVERMVRAQQSIEWIAKRRAIPTNDFVWHDEGLAVELKSTKPRYETIRGRISDAVKRAAAHGITKAHFIVDLGTAELTPELSSQLSLYNTDRTRYSIARLWVMASDGDLTEITMQ